MKPKIKYIVEKTDAGYSAFAEEYPLYTTSDTIPGLLNNAIETASLYFEETGVGFQTDNIELEIDFKQFFQYYRVLNSKFLAERIGINPTLLSQYIQGRKTPSTNQIKKIVDGIHQIGKELSDISLIYSR